MVLRLQLFGTLLRLYYKADPNMLGTTTYTMYYYGGSQRVALRTLCTDYMGTTTTTVKYLVGDHLGSTSLTLNSNATVDGRLYYKPFGQRSWPNGL